MHYLNTGKRYVSKTQRSRKDTETRESLKNTWKQGKFSGKGHPLGQQSWSKMNSPLMYFSRIPNIGKEKPSCGKAFCRAPFDDCFKWWVETFPGTSKPSKHMGAEGHVRCHSIQIPECLESCDTTTFAKNELLKKRYRRAVYHRKQVSLEHLLLNLSNGIESGFNTQKKC